jgi:ABC-type transport system involved in cytochrome c biogenesis permease subunit
MRAEYLLLYSSLALYLLSSLDALRISLRGHAEFRRPLTLVAAALCLHSLAIVLRWLRLDHGPYVNLFEILSSNVWSLHLAVFLACLGFRAIRPSLGTVLPVLQILVIWLLTVAPTDGEAPVTYATVWLAVHVWLGKVFLGCIVIAVGLYLVVILRKATARLAFPTMPGNEALDEFAYRLVLFAFIFESLMLVAGAIWAQDAWGRYWAWDPLESWAFVTWMSVAAYLHFRVMRRPPPAVSAVIVIGIFGIAFSTFFGMPFISTAPHKGAI